MMFKLFWLLLDNAESVCVGCCACQGMTFCIAMLFMTALVIWKGKG